MSETLVKVENVSKRFCKDLKTGLRYGVQDILKELAGLNSSTKLRNKEFWAVNNVSFELKRGECLGLIGHNGAGKSTLLKILNGLIKPDAGRVEMRGRVGALIELGAGFNPILTGRENIYINAQILGFAKKEIDRKFDAIVEFAEIADYIDTPVQNYSSGMKVRLGFAVAAQMEPDILIIDEVLAVGDVGFRAKCFNVISEISKKAAIILVSHSMPQIARTASKILLMSGGEKVYYGDDVPKGMECYFSLFSAEKTVEIGKENAMIEDITFYRNSEKLNEAPYNFEYLDEVSIEFKVKIFREIGRSMISFLIFDKDMRPVLSSYSATSGFYLEMDGNKSEYHVKLILPQLFLNTGAYSITFNLVEMLDKQRRGSVYYKLQNAVEFIVNKAFKGHAPVEINGIWEESVSR